MSNEYNDTPTFSDRVRRFPNKTLREAIFEVRIEKLNELLAELIADGEKPSEAKQYCAKKLKGIPNITTSVPNKRNPARRGIRSPRELTEILDLKVMQCEVDRPRSPAGFIFTVSYLGSMRNYHISHSILGKLNHLDERPAFMDASAESKRSVERQMTPRKYTHHTEDQRRIKTDGTTGSRMRFERNLHTRVDVFSNEHSPLRNRDDD
jgi:hypothetical protein